MTREPTVTFEPEDDQDDELHDLLREGEGFIAEVWRNDRGEVHRLDGPARIIRDKNGNVDREEWWKNGLLHREDGPAIVTNYQSGAFGYCHKWFREGRLHRERGPAIIDVGEQGYPLRQEWHQNGLPHRIGGPAIVRTDEETGINQEEIWCFEGALHNDDGPALIHRDEAFGRAMHQSHWVHGTPTKLPPRINDWLAEQDYFQTGHFEKMPPQKRVGTTTPRPSMNFPEPQR